ncbi:MAG: helix-turn-helix domain-containing protein [Anaerolineae bacterium]
MQYTLLPPPPALRSDVECISVVECCGAQEMALNVSPAGLPGLVFQHQNGRPVIERIVTRSGRQTSTPTLFLYGLGIEPSVMHFAAGTYSTTQFILKPHALQALFGMNAAAATNYLLDLDEFAANDLNARLLEATTTPERIQLMSEYLLARLRRSTSRDPLIEESLRLIHTNVATITVRFLLEHLSISERQFERRFSHTVGISPQSYLRIKRFNEAIRLMKNGRFERLTDVAHALHFHDQSHFVRDIKAFSGMTPAVFPKKWMSFTKTLSVSPTSEDDGFLQVSRPRTSYTHWHRSMIYEECKYAADIFVHEHQSGWLRSRCQRRHFRFPQ